MHAYLRVLAASLLAYWLVQGPRDPNGFFLFINFFYLKLYLQINFNMKFTCVHFIFFLLKLPAKERQASRQKQHTPEEQQEFLFKRLAGLTHILLAC